MPGTGGPPRRWPPTSAIGLDTPRDRAGTFEPRLVPEGARRVGGFDE